MPLLDLEPPLKPPSRPPLDYERASGAVPWWIRSGVIRFLAQWFAVVGAIYVICGLTSLLYGRPKLRLFESEVADLWQHLRWIATYSAFSAGGFLCLFMRRRRLTQR